MLALDTIQNYAICNDRPRFVVLLHTRSKSKQHLSRSPVLGSNRSEHSHNKFLAPDLIVVAYLET